MISGKSLDHPAYVDKSISWRPQLIKEPGDPQKKKKEEKRWTDRVTVLGLVCEKMAERVVLSRQEEEDRRVRQEVCSIVQDGSFDEEDMVDS